MKFLSENTDERFRLTESQRLEVERNYPYLRLIAKRIAVSLGRGRESDFVDDLTQQAVLKTISAFKSFDSSLGIKFLTYATKYLPHYLVGYSRKNSRAYEQILDDPPFKHEYHVAGKPIHQAIPEIMEEKYAIVRRYFGIGCDAEDCSQIGKSIGISRQGAHRRIQLLLLRLYHHIVDNDIDIGTI